MVISLPGIIVELPTSVEDPVVNVSPDNSPVVPNLSAEVAVLSDAPVDDPEFP